MILGNLSCFGKLNSILKATQVSEAADIHDLSGQLLNDGIKVLPKHTSDLCNLSITSKTFPNICKVDKLKPLYKKRVITDLYLSYH